MTETQKAVAAKMLTEILEEADQRERTNRVSEYEQFVRACSADADTRRKS